MKKLIAISVMFALVAGAAFAADISATLDVRMVLMQGDSGEDSKASIGGLIADGYFQTSSQNSDSTFGGVLRVKANQMTSDEPGGGGSSVAQFHRAFVWWRPIPQLRVFLGKECDGLFGTDPLTAWPFHQGAENYINYHDWDYWRTVFPGNWDQFGLAFSVYPIPGLELNLVIPTGRKAWPYEYDTRALNWEDVFGHIRFQGSFAIPDIGRIYLSWIGPGMNFDDVADNGHSGNLGVSFLLTAVQGLQVQAGISTWLAKDSDVSNYPLIAGLAAHYTGSDFGVKFRSAFEIGGFAPAGEGWRFENTSAGGLPEGNAIQFNVMPWYNLGALVGFFDIGMRMNMPDADGVDNVTNWYINPYIRVPVAGGGTIRLGLKIDGTSVEDSNVNFSLPVQFVYSF